jgi:hypothetical protein
MADTTSKTPETSTIQDSSEAAGAPAKPGFIERARDTVVDTATQVGEAAVDTAKKAKDAIVTADLNKDGKPDAGQIGAAASGAADEAGGFIGKNGFGLGAGLLLGLVGLMTGGMGMGILGALLMALIGFAVGGLLGDKNGVTNNLLGRNKAPAPGVGDSPESGKGPALTPEQEVAQAQKDAEVQLVAQLQKGPVAEIKPVGDQFAITYNELNADGARITVNATGVIEDGKFKAAKGATITATDDQGRPVKTDFKFPELPVPLKDGKPDLATLETALEGSMKGTADTYVAAIRSPQALEFGQLARAATPAVEHHRQSPEIG